MRDRLYVHIVWTTRDRQPLIDAPVAGFLAAHLALIVRQERGSLLEIGIVSTHVHVLTRIHPSTNIPRLLQRMKGGTAVGATAVRDRSLAPLRWAKGYNITSVSERALSLVGAYVREQHLRHPAEAIVGWLPVDPWLKPRLG
ncbi:MAG: transposase [Gemmatimonadales bacterium]